MALAANGKFTEESTDTQVDQIMRPVQMDANWDTIIAAGGMDDVDSAGSEIKLVSVIDNPENRIMEVRGRGTTLLLSYGYITGDTPTVGPQVQVFGRFNAGRWMRLWNKNGAHQRIMAIDTSADVDDGTHQFTHPHPLNDAYDLMGCNQILVGMDTVADAGSTATAILQGKVI